MDPLTIALAIYGGYQGYKSAKKSHANTLGKLFSTAAGAYGGYSLGTGIESLTNAAPNLAIEGGTQAGIGALASNPYGMVDPYAGTSLGMEANQFLPQATNQIPLGDATRGIGSYGPQFQQIQPTITNAAYTVPSGGASNYGLEQMPDGSWSYTQMQQPQVQQAGFDTKGYSILDSEGNNLKLKQQLEADKLAEMYKYDPQKTGTQIAKSDAARGMRLADDYSQLETSGQRIDPTKTPKSFLSEAGDVLSKTFYDKDKGIKIGNAALVGVPAALYASGAFERKPYERSMFTYNANYPDLYRSRKFYTQDPRTGEVIEMPQQDYIPEERADVQEGSKFGPYKRETITLQQGGLATLNHFKDGGVNYLPSKTIADEDDEDNYMRVNGYVEDGANNGDKEEDTMLAQLADGEFVTRTDGVLGAGILAGASPKDQKEMRKLGAEFFYEQQKRFKRIYDLLDASRKATAH